MNPLIPIEQLALLFALLATWGTWSAWRSAQRCAGGGRYLIPALRLTTILALAIVAANPGRWQAQRDHQAREWVVLLDGSGSMRTRDVANDSRWARAVRIASDVERANQAAELKFFRFDSDLHPAASAKELAGPGSQALGTDIAGNGLKLLDRFQAAGKRPLGLILLTDGRQVPPRPWNDFTIKARTMNSPVYPLMLGEAVETRDLAISTRKRQFVTFAGQPLTIVARLEVQHLSNIRPEVDLLDASNRVVATQQVTLSGGAALDVRFELKPNHEGHALYKMRVRPQPGETRLANNEASFAVMTVKDKIRILLVEGTPYWDSKFIAQLLQHQGNVDLTLVYRLTQDRYFSLDTAGELASESVLKSFPEDLESIGKYDLVVVGKGFEYFLTPERLAVLNQFVRERGGGLVFARGKPYTGRVPELEPLEPVAWEREWSGEFRWQPTESGEDAGLFGDRLPAKADPIWAKLPPLARAWQGERRKAFAQVLAEGVSGTGEQARRFPAVVSQRHGKGLVVAVNSEDLWQWDFFPKFAGASRLYQDFWLSLIHWSVLYADFLPGHDWSVRLSDQLVENGQSVRARVLSRAKHSTGVSPLIRVLRGDSVVQELSPAAVPGQNETWEGIFSLSQPGTYRVELADRDRAPAGGRAFETLTVKAPPSEDDDLSPDRDAMEKLAKDTDGRLITEKDLRELLKPDKAEEPLPSAENANWASTWDRGPWLAALLALLGCEWFLRRRNGLT